MTRPERTVVMSWVGKAVIDRTGTAIGVCTAVLTGGSDSDLWLRIDHGDQSGVAPATGASESGAQVQVQATRDLIFSAPAVLGSGSVSDGELQALREHYGAGQTDRRRLAMFGAAAALVAVAVAALRFRWLRRRQQPVTPAERLGRAARAASAALGATVAEQARARAQAGTAVAGRAVTVAAPAVAAAGQVATRSGRRVGSRAAEVTTTAASRVGDVAGTGAHLGLRVGQTVGHTVGHSLEAVPAAIGDGTEVLQKRWNRFTTRLTMGTALAGGYVLGARAGRQRYNQLTQAAQRVLSRPEVQQARERLMAPSGNQSTVRAMGDEATVDPVATTPAL